MEVSSICTPSGGIAFGLSVHLIQLTHTFPPKSNKQNWDRICGCKFQWSNQNNKHNVWVINIITWKLFATEPSLIGGRKNTSLYLSQLTG